MSEYDEYAEPINEEEEDGNTTTVQFIAVSADEHERMIREGELPASIQVTFCGNLSLCSIIWQNLPNKRRVRMCT